MILKSSMTETATIKILQLFTMLLSQKSKKPAAQMKFFKAENTKKKIGDYRIVEYGYMGDMELALVKDSNGKKWIMAGDGFTSV